MRPRLLLVLVLGLYVALFARATGYGFVWDDVLEIETNPAFDRPLIEGLTLTQTARTDPDLVGLPEIVLAYDSYRPLLFATYWLELRAFGRDPAPLHLTNLVLGALAILLAHALARRWLAAHGLPTGYTVLAATIFALHPVQVEPIAYISGRGDVLAGLLAMVATYGAWRAEEDRRWIAVAALAFLGSLLAKEACIGLPVALAALALARGREAARRWWIPGVLLGVALAYLVLRAALVTATASGALGQAIVALPGVWLEYLRIVALPFDLSSERLHAGWTVAGWGVLGALGLAVVVLRRRVAASPPTRAALGGLAWFAILLGPAAVTITTSRVAADRYAYVALLGVAVAVAAGAASLARARPRLARIAAIAGGAWFALLLVVAWRQVPVWRDNATLYAHAVAMTPESSEAHYRLGFLAAREGDWATALPLLERAVELGPRNIRALNNLGVGLMQTGRLAEAEVMLARAVEVNPAHFRAWLNLGVTRVVLGRREVGCANIARALELNPRYTVARARRDQYCAR